jgi:hypothetical protein
MANNKRGLMSTDMNDTNPMNDMDELTPAERDALNNEIEDSNRRTAQKAM